MNNSIDIQDLVNIMNRIQYPERTAHGVEYFIHKRRLIEEINLHLERQVETDQFKQATDDLVKEIIKFTSSD